MNWNDLRAIHPNLPESSTGYSQHDNGGGWVADSAVVHASTWIEQSSVVGVGCCIGECCNLHMGCNLGANCNLAVGCNLGTGCRLGAYCGLNAGCRLGANCNLGEGVEHTRTPLYIQGSRYFVAYAAPGLVQSGCITKPLSWWREHVERCAEEHIYSAEQQREYRLHVEHMATWMKLYCVDKET